MFKQLLLFLLLTVAGFSAHSVLLQVLGSGGPEIGDKRASSSYIVWIDGRSRILVDFGGGALLRFEESNARIEDIDMILLTHLHIDHTSDLPALMKASFFTGRSHDILLYGPEGNRVMPGTKTFIKRLFEDKKGAWQYMGDYLDGRASFQLKTKNVDRSRKVQTLYRKGDITIQAVTVHHGPIPAVAYRVNAGKKSITFTGDMNGAYHTVEVLAYRTDLLVAHNAVPKGAKGTAAVLHMTPDSIGRIAAESKAGSLVLSHRMLRTLGKEKETKREIQKYYRGPIVFANDKSIYTVK